MKKDFDYMAKLTDYIKKNLKKGYTQESLRWALVDQGHSKFEIEKAFKRAEEEFAREAPVLKTRPEIKYEIVEPKEIAHVKPQKSPFWRKIFGN